MLISQSIKIISLVGRRLYIGFFFSIALESAVALHLGLTGQALPKAGVPVCYIYGQLCCCIMLLYCNAAVLLPYNYNAAVFSCCCIAIVYAAVFYAAVLL